MRRLAAMAILALSACAGDLSGVQLQPDAGGYGDGGNSPTCVLSWFPNDPDASPVAPIRVSVNPGAPGVFTYDWAVSFGGTVVNFTIESSTGDSIGFIAPTAGVYDVRVNISGGFTPCPFVQSPITVFAPGANNDVYRLRAVPPVSSGVPAQEQIIQVKGGGDAVRNVTLDPGLSITGTVREGASGPGVAAYVKFMPSSAPLAFTELFTTSNGAYTTKLVGIPHDVLVVPQSSSLAPRLVAWTPSTTALVVGPGTSVTGTVRDPSGTGLAGAKVQLLAGGVPSTVGTTTGAGTFALRAELPTGAPITVKVTPPAGSGLPRLEATGAFTLTSALNIDYAASLQTCNLANTPVVRNATNQENAKVTIVGTLSGTAGTVVAGASASATGTVRVAATANGSGVLPTTLVPRSNQLAAVVQLGAADFAVDTLDTSACAATTIDAPAPIVRAGTIKDGANAALQGVRVEATPIGALALADAQTIAAVTNASGAFSIALAAGGYYDVRFVDPYARVARREELTVMAGGVPTDVAMPAALSISGNVKLSSSAQPLPGTSIQLLCAQCTGVDAARPIAYTATNGVSDYRLAVPDPGTM